jgi:ribosomal protein L34
LVLDLDLSPLPASARAEGSERGYMGRCRSKTGRKLVRLRAAQ